jgi:deoxyribodipyrimidine photolyase-related protein
MSEALIILGDQQFPPDFYLALGPRRVFMAEDFELCTHYRYHKHKLVFFLTSMRTYRDELHEHGFKICYQELDPNQSFIKALTAFLHSERISKILMVEIQDKFFESLLLKTLSLLKINVEFLDSPMFLCTRQDFKNYLFYHPKPFMKTFYEGERKRLKILVDEKNKPRGGQWSFDVENRKKPPKNLTTQNQPPFKKSIHLETVKALVEKHFSLHPGQTENFWLATSRQDALSVLSHFLEHHLESFGTYQDAITNRGPFLFHSLISPYINAGMLTPDEVIYQTLEAYEERGLPLHSVEGFIRQLMGWREFVRGIYQNFSDIEESTNFFQHERQLTQDWYTGTTGLPPLDDAIKKAGTFGYCHHIERLMILSNVMLLSEIHPVNVHSWFMEMFVDSADWVMGPNVYGMGQFSDGGVFATKPYISGSNYILKMSDYPRGEWCDTWDGLFWRFIGKHSHFFSKQPRLNFMVKMLEKMEPQRKKRLLDLAETFISNKTRR